VYGKLVEKLNNTVGLGWWWGSVYGVVDRVGGFLWGHDGDRV